MDIDFVILWVDGNDPVWQAEKQKYQPKQTTENSSVNRYRDWNLLPYWFRAVEQFAPFVRKIHFVTWGHVPAFLNLNAPKLHIVRHDEFIPLEYLPTFSSHAIEMNIHRIPGLAEHFVYFNDDMFILRSRTQEDFFKNGSPCTYGAEIPVQLKGNIGIWQHAIVNDLGIVNANFSKRDVYRKNLNKYINKEYSIRDNIRTMVLSKICPDYFTGFANLHGPVAYLKSSFQEVWDAAPDKLDLTCRHRFRASDDVNQWVVLWWQVASGNFYPKRIRNLVWEIIDELIDTICVAIKTQSHDYICLNDGASDVDEMVLAPQIIAAFETILPEKSTFEL